MSHADELSVSTTSRFGCQQAGHLGLGNVDNLNLGGGNIGSGNVSVHRVPDIDRYPNGIKRTTKYVAARPITHHGCHGEWNYTVGPTRPDNFGADATSTAKAVVRVSAGALWTSAMPERPIQDVLRPV